MMMRMIREQSQWRGWDVDPFLDAKRVNPTERSNRWILLRTYLILIVCRVDPTSSSAGARNVAGRRTHRQ